MSAYEELGDRGQVAVLREVVDDALPLLGIEARSVELVAHAFNTTFGVDLVGGGRLAVRVLTNSTADGARLRGQAAWAQALAVAGVDVAAPWTGPKGEEQVVVPAPRVGRDLRVTAAWWCPGDVVDELDADQARALGATAARMHLQAEDWAPPPGAFVELVDPLVGYPDLLTGAVRDRQSAAVVDRSIDLAQEALDRARATGVHVVHGDLHHANVLVRPAGAGWEVGAVLDWDSAWAGPADADAARAALWDDMPGSPDQPDARAAVQQLLWCLEYPEVTERHRADTARLAALLGVPVPADLG